MPFHSKTQRPRMVGLSLVDEMRWRWVAASQIGTSHIKLGTRKQDAFACFVADGTAHPICAIVCDGAGSAEFGGEGASLVCRIISVALRSHFRTSTALPSDEIVWGWLDLARDTLALVAERQSAQRRAFASTLVLLIADDNQLLIAHIGDGAVVARERTGVWQALSCPENGEYASTTYFVTDDPAPRLRISRFDGDYDGYALFSDGIEGLALDLQAMTAHEPFFRTMLNPLDALEPPGKSKELSVALAGFLASPRVCDRTDDDKTLILISRR